MFARVKKVGKYEYLQIVENRRENKKSKQRVIATLEQLESPGNTINYILGVRM